MNHGRSGIPRTDIFHLIAANLVTGLVNCLGFCPVILSLGIPMIDLIDLYHMMIDLCSAFIRNVVVPDIILSIGLILEIALPSIIGVPEEFLLVGM